MTETFERISFLCSVCGEIKPGTARMVKLHTSDGSDEPEPKTMMDSLLSKRKFVGNICGDCIDKQKCQ